MPPPQGKNPTPQAATPALVPPPPHPRLKHWALSLSPQGYSDRGVKLTTHTSLVSRLKRVQVYLHTPIRPHGEKREYLLCKWYGRYFSKKIQKDFTLKYKQIYYSTKHRHEFYNSEADATL